MLNFQTYDAGMAYAAQHQKPVVVDFSGYVCKLQKDGSIGMDASQGKEMLENNYVLITLFVDDKTSLEEPYTLRKMARSEDPIQLVTNGVICNAKFGSNAQPFLCDVRYPW